MSSRSPLDLDAYFARTGYQGPRDVTLTTLNGVVAAHIQTIPFENFDALLGSMVQLDLASLQQKLVQGHRGGYCFELNGLMFHVLEALGFKVKPISARVRIGRQRHETPPRTHLFNQVEIDGVSWLADVGVGGLSPTAAIRFELDVEQSTPHETRRIIRESGVYFHQALLAGVWTDVCEFTLEEMPPIDREVANWYTCAHPQSHFKNRILVARAAPAGVRVTLLDGEFSIRDAQGNAQKHTITSKGELLDVLRKNFGLNFGPDISINLPSMPWLA